MHYINLRFSYLLTYRSALRGHQFWL